MLPTLWVIVLATGVTIGVFTWGGPRPRRTVRGLPRPNVGGAAEALSRFSVMRRLMFAAMGLVVIVVVAAGWRGVAGASEGFEILGQVAIMAVKASGVAVLAPTLGRHGGLR